MVAAALLLVVLTQSRTDDPEAEIRRMLQRAATAAEQKDLGGIIKTWSKDFTAHRMSRNQAKGFVFANLNRGQWSRVFLVSTDVDLESETTAKVSTGAVLARGDAIERLEQLSEATRADAFRFDLDVVHEDGEWKVKRARYKRAGVKELLDPLIP